MKSSSAIADEWDADKKKLQDSAPKDDCPKCGEFLWMLEECSPNGKSAKFKCKYCGKTKTVILNAEKTFTNSGSRKPIPKAVQREVWQRDQGRCVECGSREKLEYDHIIPFSKGGSDTVRNLQLLCEHCNRKKSAQIG